MFECLYFVRSSGFGCYFLISDNGNFLLPIDLTIVNVEAAWATFIGSLTTNAGASYSLVTDISVSVSIRLSQTINQVLGLTRALQPADIDGLQDLLSVVIGDGLIGKQQVQ